MTDSELRVSSKTKGEIDAAVLRAMGGQLSSTLLRMLHEAPGHGADIASGLEISPEVVERALEALCSQELVAVIGETSGCWYRLADRRTADSIGDHLPSRPACAGASARARDGVGVSRTTA